MGKVSAPSVYNLTAKDSELINEGSELCDIIKPAEVRLAKIKELLAHIPKGSYQTVKGSTFSVTLVDEYTPIDPEVAQKLMKSKGLGKYFPKVITIAVGELKKYLCDTDINTLRSLKKVQRRLSFKK